MSLWTNTIPPKEQQQDAKRKLIIHAAGRAFRRYGFHNVSLTIVAKSLGVAKPTLYDYFRNKNEMLYECHKLGMRLVNEATNGCGGKSGYDGLLQFINNYATLLMSDEGSAAVLSDMDSLNWNHKEEIERERRHLVTVIIGFFNKEVRTMTPFQKRISANYIIGVMIWLTTWLCTQDVNNYPCTMTVETVCDLLRTGIQGEQSRF